MHKSKFRKGAGETSTLLVLAIVGMIVAVGFSVDAFAASIGHDGDTCWFCDYENEGECTQMNMVIQFQCDEPHQCAICTYEPLEDGTLASRFSCSDFDCLT